jgi:hypothetical protein
MAQLEVVTFPRLASSELALVKPWNAARDYADGETLFRAGHWPRCTLQCLATVPFTHPYFDTCRKTTH